MPVSVHPHGDVAVVRLEMARGNALGTELVAALGAALDEAAARGVAGVVLTGAGRVFSTGLDLVEASAFEGDDLGRYVDAFDDLFLRLVGFDRPVVAAINGHAVAGGCILACAAHARVAARADLAIGVSEAILGVPFPAGARLAIDLAMPPACLDRLFARNERVGAGEALGLGFVRDVVQPAALVDEAIWLARRLADDFGALLAARRAAVDACGAAIAPSRARFVEAWRSDAVRARVAAALEQVRARKAT